MKDHLLEFRGKGDRYFRAMLDAGLVVDRTNKVGIIRVAGQVSLKVKKIIIISIADRFPGGSFVAIRVDGIEPAGLGSGFDIGEGRDAKGQDEAQYDGQCDTHV